MPLYIDQREIWTGITDALLTHSLTTLKDRATQLLIKYESGALVTQLSLIKHSNISGAYHHLGILQKICTQMIFYSSHV